MTILTKTVSTKKSDKLDVPLVQNEVNETLPPNNDVELELPIHVLTIRERAKRVSTATTICACITAILVLTAGVIGGICLYRQLAKAQMHTYRAWCNVPYNKDLESYNSHYQSKQLYDYDINDSFEEKESPLYFKEEVEIDTDNDMYEEITVPDFNGGRRGRFIHDFSANKTGIIDLDGRRCFVMTLNRSLVLPPHSLLDLIVKMRAGYYEVDTEIVRDTMSVLYPPITDFKSVGYYITRECSTLNTYMLEKVPTTVRHELGTFQKRSVNEDIPTFTQFAGVKIWTVRINNLPDFNDKK